jgi:phage terminase large subunit-like protein
MSSASRLSDRFDHLAKNLPKLPPEIRRKLINKLDMAGKCRLRWLLQARAKQRTPEIHFLCDDPSRCAEAEEEAKRKYPSTHKRMLRKRLDHLISHGHLPWTVWVILAGRGWGKTRTGAEDIAKYMLEHPGARVALVAATFQDGRDTMVEGESGLLGIIPEALQLAWNRSLGELVLRNGSRAKIFSAEEPERLRGPQHHRAWCDEVATWKYRQKTWDMLLFGLRLGSNPQAIITTTPKPYKFIKKMLEESKDPRNGIILTSGHTFENRPNLPGIVLQKLEDAYANTRIGRQELAAEVLEDLEGGLIRAEYIDERRLEPWNVTATAGTYEIGELLQRVVIAVDPAVTADPETSNETGIIVCGKTRAPCPFCSKSDNPRGRAHAVVFECHSGILTDAEWARRVVDVYKRLHADRVIAEKNNGGDLVASVMHAVEPGLPIKLVWASRGKVKRAEPVAACYERREVHHLQTTFGNSLVELEDQLLILGVEDEEEDEPTVSSTEDEVVKMDRADACVWGLTELMVPESDALIIKKVADKRAVATR